MFKNGMRISAGGRERNDGFKNREREKKKTCGIMALNRGDYGGFKSS